MSGCTSLSDQNTITSYAPGPWLVSHQNSKVNSVKKITQVRLSGANSCTDMLNVFTLQGWLILWFMRTQNRDAQNAIKVLIGVVWSHTVGGTRAHCNCSHVWYSNHNLKTTQPCFGWPPYKGTSPSTVHGIFCKEQRAGSLAVTHKRNQDWKEVIQYLIIRFLKAGLCFTSHGWGRNTHPPLLPQCHTRTICSELPAECWMHTSKPWTWNWSSKLYSFYHPTHHQFQYFCSLSAQHHPTARWRSPVGPSFRLWPTCWVIVASIPANVTHMRTSPICPKLLGVQKCYTSAKLLGPSFYMWSRQN